jgi:hypothetical protein
MPFKTADTGRCNGNSEATLHLQNDGNLVLLSATNQQLWSSDTAVRPEPTPPTKIGFLLSSEGLAVGTRLTSSNGNYTLRLQSDANLVLVDEYAQPLWSSGTNGDMGVWDLTMQTDGNLVLHDQHGQPLWASGTNGNPGATLEMQDDGNLVIHDEANNALWASNTEVGVEVLAH